MHLDDELGVVIRKPGRALEVDLELVLSRGLDDPDVLVILLKLDIQLTVVWSVVLEVHHEEALALCSDRDVLHVDLVLRFWEDYYRESVFLDFQAGVEEGGVYCGELDFEFVGIVYFELNSDRLMEYSIYQNFIQV